MERNVLVVGDNDLAGLATVRSLGEAGLDVHLVAFEKSAITRSSRHVRRVHHLGHPLEEPDAFVDGFLRLIRQLPFDLAIPTSDKALVPLMGQREEIERYTRFTGPDRAGFEATYHKAKTLELAGRVGVPIPRTVVLHQPAEVAGFESFAGFPLVLKPSNSVLPRTALKNEVRFVRSADELRHRLPRMLRRGCVLVQEFCPGHGVGLCVLAQAGEVVAAVQHERVHEPPHGGASSYRKTVTLDPELLGMARRLMAELRWTGPAMIEFKVDPATGRSVLMEINGRLWGSLALAIQAGVDFPRLMYDLYVRGRARPAFTYRTPFFVRHTPKDLEWLLTNIRTPAGRMDLLRKSGADLVRELSAVVGFREGYDLESWTDPVPGLVGWLEFGREAVASLRRKWNSWQWLMTARRKVSEVARRAPRLRDRLRRVRSVVFVCQGNVNRSALAEAVWRAGGTADPIKVASAGLLPGPGRRSGELSQAVAQEFGYSLAEHRSQDLTPELVQAADLLLVMETAHLEGVWQLCPEGLSKTYPLSAFGLPPAAADIPDPEGQDRTLFRRTYQTVIDCVTGLQDMIDALQAGDQSLQGKDRSSWSASLLHSFMAR